MDEPQQTEQPDREQVEYVMWYDPDTDLGKLQYRVAALEEENRLLKQKLLDIEAYFQSGRR